MSDGIPEGLKTRGAALWRDLGLTEGSAQGVVAVEACRAADRLDELDRIIAGKGVLDLMRFRLHPDWWDDDGEQHVTVDVKFDSALAEARNQQTTLVRLLADLRQAGAKPKSTSAPAPKRPANVRDQLKQRREAREQKA